MSQKVDHLSVHTRALRAEERARAARRLQVIEQFPQGKQEQPDSPFPYLETILKVAKDYPYQAIGIMISIAAIVMAAVTVLAVSVIGGMFLMYGQMREVSITQKTLLTQYQETRAEVRDTGNVMRTYENMNGKRTEFLISLMDPAQQARFREWERTHPFPIMPQSAPPKENKEN